MLASTNGFGSETNRSYQLPSYTVCVTIHIQVQHRRMKGDGLSLCNICEGDGLYIQHIRSY